MIQNRRDFIKTLSAAGIVMPVAMPFEPNTETPPQTRYPIRLFSKAIDSYDFDFMCECLVRSGIGGFDLTVRQGGKVKPESVETDLPKLTGMAKRYDLAIDMMVSGILSASDPLTERVLKTAAGSGIKDYRLGWFSYDKKPVVWETVQKYRPALREIAEMNRKYNIHGSYQNHSGLMVGGSVWDLNELLRDLPAEYLGAQYDVRHATVEGANTWVIGMRLIAGHIRTLAIKDFTWKCAGGRAEEVTVPLGEGMVNWELYFSTLKEMDISGPITLHIEYPLLEAGEDKLSLVRQQEIIVGKLKKDMAFLTGYLKKYELF